MTAEPEIEGVEACVDRLPMNGRDMRDHASAAGHRAGALRHGVGQVDDRLVADHAPCFSG